MSLLKKKFGKFAVSSEKMAKVSGGNMAPDPLCDDCGGSGSTWTCWDRSGKTTNYYSEGDAIEAFTTLGGYDGCSEDEPTYTY